MNTNAKSKTTDLIKEVLPCISILFTLLLQLMIPDSASHPQADAHYFTYVLWISLVVWALIFILSFFRQNVRKKLIYKGYFIAGAILFLNMVNLLTVKSALLPVLYFPSLDRIWRIPDTYMNWVEKVSWGNNSPRTGCSLRCL